MRINKNAIKNKIQHYKMTIKYALEDFRTKGKDDKIENELVDRASKDSFPASDPPAYLSKSPPDEDVQRAP